MSGRVASALSTASLPVSASPTTSQPSSASKIDRTPDRTTSWSSAIKMRVIARLFQWQPTDGAETWEQSRRYLSSNPEAVNWLKTLESMASDPENRDAAHPATVVTELVQCAAAPH
jgi:hypothetical protein